MRGHARLRSLQACFAHAAEANTETTQRTDNILSEERSGGTLSENNDLYYAILTCNMPS